MAGTTIIWIGLAVTFVVIGSLIWISDKRRELAESRRALLREQESRATVEEELRDARSPRRNR